MLEPFAPSDDAELLCELASRELPEGQALHGDAHLFNCLQTTAGPIWHDLETACRGPREYDLAALVLDDRSKADPEARTALAAYGSYDEEFLELQGIMIQGDVRILEDAAAEEAEADLPEVRRIMGAKYAGGHGEAPSEEPAMMAASARGRSWRWVAITPTHVVTWDNTKIPR